MSNPHCECAGPGWCERHKLEKSETMFRHCQLMQSASIKYWRAWEQGQLGATAPEDAELFSRGVGDRVAKVIDRTTRGRVKSCSGCKKRQAALNHLMPGDRYPELTKTTLEWDKCTRNLLYFIWPVASNDFWKWNLDQLRNRMESFNGRRLITVATDSATVSSRDVAQYLGCDVEYRVVKNNKRLREAAHWAKSLSAVESRDPLQITFSGHAKCARLGWRYADGDPAAQHVTAAWTDMMYQSCLDRPKLVAEQLSEFGITGSFKKYGQFTTRNNHRWHYTGTFYWFRNRDVFRRNWMHVDKRFFGSESWPGALFRPNEAGSLFLDDCGDMYDASVVFNEVVPQFEEWMRDTQN